VYLFINDVEIIINENFMILGGFRGKEVYNVVLGFIITVQSVTFWRNLSWKQIQYVSSRLHGVMAENVSVYVKKVGSANQVLFGTLKALSKYRVIP
jgi:hypothetical protein